MRASQIRDITKERFGRLLVIELDLEKTNNTKKRKSSWFCLCNCGNIISVQANSLRTGNTVSCGCYKKEVNSENIKKLSTTHGMSKSKEFHIWHGMRQRCTNSNDKDYANYGGRGITVCSEWLNSFEAFFADMGICPDDCSIDRINNSKGYSKSNCKYSTTTEQGSNKRNNVFIEFNNKKQTLAQWSREVNIPAGAINLRIKRGWSVEKALTTPLMRNQHR